MNLFCDPCYRSSYKSANYILPVVVFSFVYTIPKFFELKLVNQDDDPVAFRALMNSSGRNNGSFPDSLVVPTELRQNKLYFILYLICSNFVVQILIPFVTLVVLNYKTYRCIKDSERNLIQNYCVHFNNRNAAPTTEKADGVMLQIVHERRKSILNEMAASQNVLQMVPITMSTDEEPDVMVVASAWRHLTSNEENQINKATSLRKREVVLSRISFYIVFVFLFCHSLRIVPNLYEMIHTQVKINKAKLFSKHLLNAVPEICPSRLGDSEQSCAEHCFANFCAKFLPTFSIIVKLWAR